MAKLKFRTCKNNTNLAGATTHMKDSVKKLQFGCILKLIVIAKCGCSLKSTSRKIIPIKRKLKEAITSCKIKGMQRS